MTLVWSHRPQFLHLALFFAAYLLAAGFAQILAIVPGTGISIWPPSGLFMATLIIAPGRNWPWWVLTALLAELSANVLWFHNPLPVAALIFTGNALEAAVGAWLVNRTCRRSVRLDTPREILALVVLGAGVAPIVSATVGSATLAVFGMQSFATAWPLWWIGDATGILIVAPLALAVLQNWRGEARLSAAQWVEACVLGLVFLGVAALSLGGYLPFAYIIMPPLLWAAVRFDFKGAAVALILLALITVVFTITGASQFVGDPETQKQRQVMLQLFLAISAISVLIVAAISRQHRQTLLTLRESERELSQLVDMVPSHLWRLTPDGEPTFFNKRMVDFLGLDVADTDKPGMSRLEAMIAAGIHPEDATAFGNALRRCLATGEAFAMRYRLRRVDGAYRWMSGRAEPLRDASGRIVQWFGLCHDIDDQMRLYSDIEEREARIRRLVDSDVIGIVFWDLDGRLIEANDAFLRMVQYDREDLKAGIDWLAMTPPEWREVHAREEAEELARTGKMQAREKEYFRKDGSRVPVLIGAACFEGQSRQGVAYILDLTERKRAESALRDRERELARLVDTVPVQIWCVTPGADPAYINKTMMDYIGMKLEDFDASGGLPSAIQTIVHPDDRSGLLQGLTHAFKTGERFEQKFRNRRWDGEYRWTEGHADPLHDESGRIIRWYGANVDIHDHVISQEALRERERFLWQLVETLPAMIDCAAPNGEPVFRSQQLREFLGYNLEELDETGKSRLAGTLEAGVHPDDLAGVKESYARSLSTGEPYARRHRLRRFDGEYRWVETRAAPMRNAEGAIVQWNVICLDIDGEVRAQEELRLAQEKLARASQAASLAELSASIAHEVNQPLAAIVANSHACHRWLSAEPANIDRAKLTAERIIRDANSAADVVSRIRALFKRSAETRAPVSYTDVLAEARDLLANDAARHRVRMDIDVAHDLPPVALDRIQVQQVLVNLIRNGLEAMESGMDDGVLRVRVHRAGDAIQTEISDRGPGIECPDRIFEPFFTTKNRGLGMGLAICRSIVESHGGRLWAESNRPQGATFAFTLPIEAKAES